MNKETRYIPAASSLVDWLLEQLEREPPQGGSELAAGLRELRAGTAGSLVLGAPEAAQAVQESIPGAITAGDLKIFLKSRRVLFGDSEIGLTPKEFDILYFLAENRGVVFTKEQIYKAVWSEEYLLDDSNIMAFIRKLRKKIEPDPDAPRYILTIWGVGYKFNDEI